jgi:hypothetical protein
MCGAMFARDDLAEQIARAVGDIGGNPLGLEVEACLDAVEHGLDHIDLYRDPGRRRLDVDNHPVPEIAR